MNRVVSILLLLLAGALPSLAEEISMKDGTKIVGHMTAVTTDKIEVETAYGKMQLKRSEILTISFPENNPNAPPEAVTAKKELPRIDEALTGARYINRTGKFSLTVPTDWVINPDLRRAPETLAALSSQDKMRFVMVIQEEYPGSLQSYKEISMLAVRRNLGSFEELSESPVTIDGKAGLLIFYRGTLTKTNNLPVEFLTAIIPSGNSYTKVTAWCVEPLFHDMQPTFEKIVSSYRSTGQSTAVAGSLKP